MESTSILCDMEISFAGKHPSQYFDQRIRSASELKRLLPYRPVLIGELERQLDLSANQTNRCLYLHIPFCRKACNFCGYYKCVGESVETMTKYVSKIKEQLKLFGKSNWVKSQPFSAVYFGGGTPTALPVHLFNDLVNSIGVEIPLTPDVEFTVETSVSELSDDYLTLFRNSAVNRVSMGIQSFNETLRHQHSRIAGFSEIKSLVEKLNTAGIENRCADLMYNLEGQTLQTWESDLKTIQELNFTGCSVYPLLPFPGAPMVRNNTYPKPVPQLEFRYFQMADSFLCNLTEWDAFTSVQYGHAALGRANYVCQQAIDADILALGPGAGGKINGIQYLNAFSLDDFLAEETKCFSHKSRVFELPPTFQHLEQQLRLFKAASMDKITFDLLFGKQTKLVSKLIEFHLLEVSKQKVLLTQTGRFWAANIAALFIDNSLKDL